MYEWRTGRSCVYKNNVHLVFVTKYRRDVFTVEMLESTRAVMMETCLQMDCELMEFGGEDDHINMMISVHPKVAVSNLVGKLKGKSAFMLRRDHWEQVKGKLWGNHFWSPSYCVVSCGGASLEVVKAYIDQQKSPPSAKSVKQSRALAKVK
ncbi:TPA: IS200/IS605 family transposase [Klebsiella pneumoniae]